jgi:hypothetical protein
MYTDADFIHEEFRLARVSEKHFDSGNVSGVEFNRETDRLRGHPEIQALTVGPQAEYRNPRGCADRRGSK